MEETHKRRLPTGSELLLIVAPLVPVWALRLVLQPEHSLGRMFVVAFPLMFSFFYLCFIAGTRKSKIKTTAKVVAICSFVAGVLG